MNNPLKKDSSYMLNIVTWQAATATINVFWNVKQIAKTELQKWLNDISKKVQKVKLHTFEELHAKQQQTVPQKQK